MTFVRDALAVVGAWFLLSVGALFGFVVARDWLRRRAARRYPGFTPSQVKALRRLDKEMSR